MGAHELRIKCTLMRNSRVSVPDMADTDHTFGPKNVPIFGRISHRFINITVRFVRKSKINVQHRFSHKTSHFTPSCATLSNTVGYVICGLVLHCVCTAWLRKTNLKVPRKLYIFGTALIYLFGSVQEIKHHRK